jgi:hypothetical protein
MKAKAIARLNAIVERTGAKVVVSSSWRHRWPLEKLRQVLRLAGASCEVIDVAPRAQGVGLGRHRRPMAIFAWLAQHRAATLDSGPVYVVLDDQNMPPDYFGAEFVQTSWQHGLQDEHVERAVGGLGEVANG